MLSKIVTSKPSVNTYSACRCRVNRRFCCPTLQASQRRLETAYLHHAPQMIVLINALHAYHRVLRNQLAAIADLLTAQVRAATLRALEAATLRAESTACNPSSERAETWPRSFRSSSFHLCCIARRKSLGSRVRGILVRQRLRSFRQASSFARRASQSFATRCSNRLRRYAGFWPNATPC